MEANVNPGSNMEGIEQQVLRMALNDPDAVTSAGSDTDEPYISSSSTTTGIRDPLPLVPITEASSSPLVPLDESDYKELTPEESDALMAKVAMDAAAKVISVSQQPKVATSPLGATPLANNNQPRVKNLAELKQGLRDSIQHMTPEQQGKAFQGFFGHHKEGHESDGDDEDYMAQPSSSPWSLGTDKRTNAERFMDENTSLEAGNSQQGPQIPSAHEDGFWSWARSKFSSYKLRPASMVQGSSSLPEGLLNKASFGDKLKDSGRTGSMDIHIKNKANEGVSGTIYQVRGLTSNIYVYPGDYGVERKSFIMGVRSNPTPVDATFSFRHPTNQSEVNVDLKVDLPDVHEALRSHVWVAHIGVEGLWIVLRFDPEDNKNPSLEQVVVMVDQGDTGLSASAKKTEAKVSQVQVKLPALSGPEKALAEYVLCGQPLALHTLPETHTLKGEEFKRAHDAISFALPHLLAAYPTLNVPVLGHEAGHAASLSLPTLLKQFARDQLAQEQQQQQQKTSSSFSPSMTLAQQRGLRLALYLHARLAQDKAQEDRVVQVLQTLGNVNKALEMVRVNSTARAAHVRTNNLFQAPLGERAKPRQMHKDHVA